MAVLGDGVFEGGVFGVGEGEEAAGLEDDFATQLVEALGDPGGCDAELGRYLVEAVAVGHQFADLDADRLAAGREGLQVDAG